MVFSEIFSILCQHREFPINKQFLILKIHKDLYSLNQEIMSSTYSQLKKVCQKITGGIRNDVETFVWGQLNHSQVDQQKVLENNIDYWELEL